MYRNGMRLPKDNNGSLTVSLSNKATYMGKSQGRGSRSGATWSRPAAYEAGALQKLF
jgi:hypothetical protein